MFIHFGLYSVIGRGEWYYMQYVPDQKEYESTINKFKAIAKWAEHLVKTAKRAGAKLYYAYNAPSRWLFFVRYLRFKRF